MAGTPRLALPFLSVGQAQKEFTHNESLQTLDILVAGAIEEPPRVTPPRHRHWVPATSSVSRQPMRGLECPEVSRRGLPAVGASCHRSTAWSCTSASAGPAQPIGTAPGSSERFGPARWSSAVSRLPGKGGPPLNRRAEARSSMPRDGERSLRFLMRCASTV